MVDFVVVNNKRHIDIAIAALVHVTHEGQQDQQTHRLINRFLKHWSKQCDKKIDKEWVKGCKGLIAGDWQKEDPGKTHN